MGGQSRYKVAMFDHDWRVLVQSQTGDKDLEICASDDFASADAAYEVAVANSPDRVVLLMQRTRIVKRSDR